MSGTNARLMAAAFLVLILGGTAWGQHHPPTATVPAAMDPAKWQDDLRFFAAELPQRHKNLFHKMPREQFEAAIRRLDARIPALQRHEIIVELARIVAMIGDGHTHMSIGFDSRIGFRRYPIELEQFKDGLFVRAASPEYAHAVGGRVIRIGKSPTEQAMAAVREIVARDNEMWVGFLGPRLLAMPEVLAGLGLVEDMEKVPWAVEKDGKQFTVEFRPVAADPNRNMHAFGPPPEWVDMRSGAAAPTPLWLKDPNNSFWYEYLPDSRTLYVQYNEVANKPDETVRAFFQRVYQFVDANPVDRFVLDLRLNGGGNNFLNLPIIHGLIRSDKVNQKGKLFTIIGRRTFSAAQNCVNQLERHTQTLFVGEPTGAIPNHYGDARRIVLPNSGIGVQASTLWWQDVDPRDRRPWTAPHIAAEMTSTDYRTNCDPVLEAILRYSDRKPLADLVRGAVEKKEIEAARQAIRDYRADPQNAYANFEA
ncbi:MAG: hypothetical protein ACRD24_08020, partial [Terriglobales bacterium]